MTIESLKAEARKEFAKELSAHFNVKHSGGTNDILSSLDSLIEKAFAAGRKYQANFDLEAIKTADAVMLPGSARTPKPLRD